MTIKMPDSLQSTFSVSLPDDTICGHSFVMERLARQATTFLLNHEDFFHKTTFVTYGVSVVEYRMEFVPLTKRALQDLLHQAYQAGLYKQPLHIDGSRE